MSPATGAHLRTGSPELCNPSLGNFSLLLGPQGCLVRIQITLFSVQMSWLWM